MKNKSCKFLVRAIEGDHDRHTALTKNKIYLGIRGISGRFIKIDTDDRGNRAVGFFAHRFKILSFVDIWELKRNESTIPTKI